MSPLFVPWFKEKFYGDAEAENTVIDTNIVFCKTRPDIADSDHDKLDDSHDAEPVKSLENGFNTNIVYTSETPFNALIPDGTREQYETNKAFYLTLPSNYWEEVKIVAINDFLYHCGLCASLTTFPNAGPLLMKYFLQVPEGFVTELPCKYYEAVIDTRAMRYSYYNDMNLLMKNAEAYLTEGASTDLSVVNGLGGICYTWQTNLFLAAKNLTMREKDYYVAVSSGGTSMKSKVSCKKDENGKIYYEADVKYYTFDSYDFDEGDIDFLHNAIGYGYAFPFYTYGLYETKIKWYKGSRYPSYTQQSEVNLDDCIFDGITDDLEDYMYYTTKSNMLGNNVNPLEALINILYFDTKYLN